ncbi:MAG: (2Fe-2S)-binding protein [Treponema sp.]|jgi:NADH-quinone oxidoreductase subunit G/NADP-reducing hydrogenase subunit HndD|nr:(2Fe-2S)-binding protein [Treponema sp.]
MSYYKPDPGKNVSLTIDSIPVTVPEGTTILEAARKANVSIPTLCDHPGLGRRSVCRLCVVEVDGRGKLMAACANDAGEGMSIITNNARIVSIRKMIVELLLANHPQDCLNCIRSTSCELQSLAARFGIRASPFRRRAAAFRPPKIENNILTRDMDKCIKCGRCVEACQEVQTVKAINTSCRSIRYEIVSPYGMALADGPCTFCGQCAEVCPVGAIYEYDQSAGVWAALNNSEGLTAALIGPQIQAALGKELGPEAGLVTGGKTVTALKRLGFDKVFDAGFFAGITITEQSHELLDRINNGPAPGKRLPLVIGCSPAWNNFAGYFYPDLIECLSTAESPQRIFGTLVKTCYPRMCGMDTAAITAVSIVPCIAKKFEARQPLADSALDIALVPRELARMIRLAGISIAALPEIPFDNFMGGSPQAAGCGCTGGAAAVLQKAYTVHTGGIPGPVVFTETPGQPGISRAEFDLKGIKITALIVNGLVNARKVMDSIRHGECDATLVEVVDCYCGRNKFQGSQNKSLVQDYRRDSCAADGLDTLYEQFLGKPLGEKSRELLHTRYSPRGKR